MSFFTKNNIIKMAAEMEQNDYAFYNPDKAIQLVQNEEKAVNAIIKEEGNHTKKLRALTG